MTYETKYAIGQEVYYFLGDTIKLTTIAAVTIDDKDQIVYIEKVEQGKPMMFLEEFCHTDLDILKENVKRCLKEDFEERLKLVDSLEPITDA